MNVHLKKLQNEIDALKKEMDLYVEEDSKQQEKLRSIENTHRHLNRQLELASKELESVAEGCLTMEAKRVTLRSQLSSLHNQQVLHLSGRDLTWLARSE